MLARDDFDFHDPDRAGPVAGEAIEQSVAVGLCGQNQRE
jgi:hypothetical protein